MKNCLPILLLICLAWGCGDKKADLSGETPIKVKDFISAFRVIPGAYTVADTNLAKAGDTLIIGYKALQQFFPDSALTAIVGNNKKVVVHPVGVIEKNKEKYLLLKFGFGKKNTRLAVFVVDDKNKYLASKQLLNTSNDDGYMHSLSVNREPTFLLSRERMGKNNTIQYSRTGWVYNSAGLFMIVINDSNEDSKRPNVVINPIDTLPKKNKFSGDYVRDKKNFISLRDTKKPDVYQFFIHFEKEGNCTGELKGEMKMKTPGSAIFTQNGDPCIIDFTFEGNEITVKEQGSCGNHRGIKCYFDDTFVRKREKTKKK